MKRVLLFSTILFLSFLNGFSQKKTGDEIFFSIGPSIPVGNFASHNFQNNNAGLARTGEQLNFSYEHKLNKIFGIAASLYTQRNPVDISRVGYYTPITESGRPYFFSYSLITTDPLPQTDTFVPYKNLKFNKTSWFHSSILLGFTVELPLSKINNKLTFTTKLMAGLVYAFSPKLYGSGETDTSKATLTQSRVAGFGFSYLYNAELRYRITQKTSLQFGIDYFGTSTVTFKNVKETFNASSVSGSGLNTLGYSSSAINTSNGNQKIAVLNCNIGIGIRL